ncbi:MAG: ABC transporter permease subunit [Schleiferilactobacillus harbinensis]|jgi:uncharacterized protein with PQ loop repeat|nr:ABC transporter permease subunit [Schleiferilactobacillus harbinensis]MCI1912609.1 ABC transporter permease subunit [Schleiferilactobacillus harbinensis]
MWWEFRQWRRQWLNWVLFGLGFLVIIGSYVAVTKQAQQENDLEYATLLSESQQLTDADDHLASQEQTDKVDKQRQTIQQEQKIVTLYGRALTDQEATLLTHRLAYYQLLQKPAFPFSQRSTAEIEHALRRDRYLQAHRIMPQENARALSPANFFARSQNAVVFLLILGILIVQWGGLFARDWETGSIRLLLMLPNWRRHLSRTKIGLALVVSGGELILWLFSGYLIAAVRAKQFWGGNYPWAQQSLGSTVVTLNDVVGVNMITILLLIGLVVVVLYWLSILIRDRFTVMVALVAVLASGALFFGQSSNSIWAGVNPFYQLTLSSHTGLRNPLGYGILTSIADIVLISAWAGAGHFWWRKRI